MGHTDQAVLKLCSRSYACQDIVVDEADSTHMNNKLSLSLLLGPASLANRLASHLDWWHTGKKVAVLEARVIGGGQSGKDTGAPGTIIPISGWKVCIAQRKPQELLQVRKQLLILLRLL